MLSVKVCGLGALLLFGVSGNHKEQARKPGSAPHAVTVSGAVTALAFSPNGKTLAVGRLRTVALLDTATGRVRLTLTGLEGAVTSLVFSADGSVLAAGSGTPGKDGEVEMWRTGSGKRLGSLSGHTDLIYGISLRADQRQLAAVSYDHLVSLWKLDGLTHAPRPTGGPRFLRDHTDAVYGLDYSPNGKQLATAAGDRTIKIWDTETGKRLFTFSESTAEQYAVAYRPGGAQLAAGGVDKTLRVWNLDGNGGTLAHSAFAHDGAILRVLYAHNGRSLFTCGEDNRLKEWDADTLTERGVYPRQPDWPQSLALSPDDRLLAVGCYDGSLSIYDTRTHEPVFRPAAPRRPMAVTREEPVTDLPVARFAHCMADAQAPDVEVKQQPGNETPAAAQGIPVPSVITGTLWNGRPTSAAPSHYYRFEARKAQTLVLDVLAHRAGSPLDSEIEVLDTRGKPVERAVLRSVGQTELTLSDRDSASTGMRLLLRRDFNMNDYVLAGREVIQISALPKGPDDDYQFRSYRGQRSGFFGTTPEFHSVGAPVYKVEVHPPGSTFSPNGMPLTHIYYKNDDGGPLFGRDSYLEFTPPADGQYIVRIGDVRGQQGDKFTYKLRVHAPRPDFSVSLNPAAVSIPKNGATVVSIECERHEGFGGEITVRLEGLPAGFTATEGVIEAGETGSSLWISAPPEMPDPKIDATASYRVVASAEIEGRQAAHTTEPDVKNRHLTVGTASNVQVVTDLREVSIKPGGEAVVEARITRLNGFKGRVPLDVRNLPYGVRVDDIGLNGVLINEQETARKFVLRCEPWVRPQSRLFYVTAGVEGGVGNTALPLTLNIASSPAAASR